MGAAWYKSLFCLQVSLFAILSDCKSPLYYRIQYFSFSKVYHDHVGSYLDSSLLTSSSLVHSVKSATFSSMRMGSNSKRSRYRFNTSKHSLLRIDQDICI